MIKSVAFAAETPGPKLLVLGAVHGNEPCGAVAIPHVIAELMTGKRNLVRGRVTFVPVCNPRAYAAGERYIDRNLNRYLVPQAHPDCYEARLGNILCGLLADCDALLDLHSTPRGNEPHVYVEPSNPAEYAYAAHLGLRTLITGWEDVYAATDRKAVEQIHPDEGIGTEQAVRRRGGLAALVECGQDGDPQAVEVAYRAIHNALKHFGMVEEKALASGATRLVRMTKVYYRDDNGAFTRPWRDFDPVEAGEPMAIRANGTRLCAPANGLVVMPQPDCALGPEWFYFGVEETRD